MFLAAVTVLGAVLIVFTPSPLTVVVDAACWAGTTALAQAGMGLLGWPA
jgi:hypothetical protein